MPVYETENMISRTDSYTSDDYFGLLADGAGLWLTVNERVQLGIGRLPVRTAAEARDLVDKIQRYESPVSLGAWRSTVTFVGDDNYPNTWDHDLHVRNADGTAQQAEVTDPTLTVQKIYAPTYPLVSTVVGNRRPAATEAVIRSINEGTLIWNYSGHGSPENLGDERYFTEDVLNSLDNTARPTIFVTATCSFGKFDLEVNQSMAEQVLLRPQGGGIAMFTTVRIVYTSSQPTDGTNFGLNVTLTDQMLRRDADGRPLTPRRRALRDQEHGHRREPQQPQVQPSWRPGDAHRPARAAASGSRRRRRSAPTTRRPSRARSSAPTASPTPPSRASSTSRCTTRSASRSCRASPATTAFRSTRT